MFQTECFHEWQPLHCALVIDFIYHYFHNCCFHVSIFYLLICMWDHVVDVLLLCIIFVCFIPRYDCWFLFVMLINPFHLSSLNLYVSFNYRLQCFHYMRFSLWSSHIWSYWLCITNLIHYWSFNIFLAFLNWLILLIFEWIVIITLYKFL